MGEDTHEAAGRTANAVPSPCPSPRTSFQAVATSQCFLQGKLGAGTHGGSQEESGPDSGNVLSFPIHEKCHGGSRAHPPARGLCVKLHLRLHAVEEEVGQFLRAGGHGALQQLLHPLQALLLQLLQRLQELLAPLLVGSDNSGSLIRSRVGSESSGSSIPSQGGVCGVCDTWSCSMSSSAA